MSTRLTENRGFDAVAPMVLTPWTAALAGTLLTQRWWSAPVGVAVGLHDRGARLARQRHDIGEVFAGQRAELAAVLEVGVWVGCQLRGHVGLRPGVDD